jgi:hypothetical protein
MPHLKSLSCIFATANNVLCVGGDALTVYIPQALPQASTWSELWRFGRLVGFGDANDLAVTPTVTSQPSAKICQRSVGHFTALGCNSIHSVSRMDAVRGVVQHALSVIVGGDPSTLSLSVTTNVAVFKNSKLSAAAGGRLNGIVIAGILVNILPMNAKATHGAFNVVAVYTVTQDKWALLQAGAYSTVASLNVTTSGVVQLAGNTAHSNGQTQLVLLSGFLAHQFP